VPLLELAQAGEQLLAACLRRRREVVADHHVENGLCRRRRQRVRDVRGHVGEAHLEAALLDVRRGDQGRHRHPTAERLRQHEEVRHDVVDLEAVHRAEPAEAGLALVEHEQHAALVTQLGHAHEVARRRHDHAAR
jgi:hypothetical protein